MKAVTRILFISILILVVLPRWGQTCLPEFPQVVFTRPSGPDKPMSKFAAGRIGVPLPTWRRAFLVVAYRYLDEKPLSAAEQHSLLDFFDNNGVLGSNPADSAAKRWLTERAKYQDGPQPTVVVFRNGSSPYSGFLNCLAPAFENAVMTLRTRAQQFGSHTPELREWIDGQDEVFHNCHEGPSKPDVLPTTANALLRADRAYQTATADFYSLRLQEALAEFDAISKDSASPWHHIAAYMAARTIIREAWVSVKEGTDEEYDPAILRQVEPRLIAIISDPKFGTLRQGARRLEALVKFHLHPEQRQHELAHILLTGSGSDFGQQLLDYKLLLDRFLDVDPPFDDGLSWGTDYDRRVRAWKRSLYPKLRKQRSDDLTDWLVTLQSDALEAKTHALSKWRSENSRPWLFAAMVKSDGTDDSTPELLRAASEEPETSKVFPAIAFHRSRLLRESVQPELAEKVVEAALQQGDALPPSARNLLEDERLRNSADFASFQSRLVRNPVGVSVGADPSGEDAFCYYRSKDCNLLLYGAPNVKPSTPLMPQFDLSVAEVLNKRIPVEILAKTALSESLPTNMRQHLAESVWARAALLGNTGAAQEIRDTAATLRPELKPYIDQYSSASTNEERHFAAVFAIIHFPGLRPFVADGYVRTTNFKEIDDYRDNWWCTDVGGIPDDLNYEKQYGDNLAQVAQFEKRVEASSPVFLTGEQTAKAAEEWKQLLSMGLAADYLPRQVLEWAKVHPDDPRVPEALHFAWRVGRYGCSDNRENVQAPDWSREIFKLLHKRYPDSVWTKKTRTWG